MSPANEPHELVSPLLKTMAPVSLLLIVMMLSTPAHARRRGLALYSSGDTIAEVADLDDQEPYGSANLGWKYYEFAIFWMPLYAGEGSFVLFEETADGYLYDDVSPAVAEQMATASGMTAPKPGFLSLYWGWGGLAVLGVLFGVYSTFAGGDDDEEGEAQPE